MLPPSHQPADQTFGQRPMRPWASEANEQDQVGAADVVEVTEEGVVVSEGEFGGRDAVVEGVVGVVVVA